MKLICVSAGVMLFIFFVMLLFGLWRCSDRKLISDQACILGLGTICAFGLLLFAIMMSWLWGNVGVSTYAKYLAGGFCTPMGFVITFICVAICG